MNLDALLEQVLIIVESAFGGGDSFKSPPLFSSSCLVFLFSFSALRGNIAQEVRS